MSIEYYILAYAVGGAASSILWASRRCMAFPITLSMIILRFVLWPYFSTRDSIKGSRKAWRSLHKE